MVVHVVECELALRSTLLLLMKPELCHDAIPAARGGRFNKNLLLDPMAPVEDPALIILAMPILQAVPRGKRAVSLWFHTGQNSQVDLFRLVYNPG